jgi:hypothetical protein
VRPLALPWPYTLEAGSKIERAVTLTVSGKPPVAAGGGGSIRVRVREFLGPTPALGLGLDPDEADAVIAKASTLRDLGASHIICHYDPRRGHNRETLERLALAAKALSATPWLEAVIAKVEGVQDEIAALGEVVDQLGSPFPVVLVSPASDLKCTLPGSPWPSCPPADELYSLARRAFPNARLGGGMFSYFTELNRKRPPLADIDFVSFTTSALVHAGDDRSVTEGLESLPHIAKSVRSFIGDRPYCVGPNAIGMRDNPYGESPMPNPNNLRQAMNRNDPRQRGLLGAAWNLGYFTHFAQGGAQAITLGGALGPFGLLHTPAAYPQPWFDDRGGLFPSFHVVKGLARLQGAPMRRTEVSSPREVQAFAASVKGGEEIWLANLTGEPQRVTLSATSTAGHLSCLDASRFSALADHADALDKLTKPFLDGEIELDAYAVARLRFG